MKKLFTKEIQIAIVAIVAGIFLVFTINFLKGISLFQSGNNYYVTFENIKGLTEANGVYANGYAIGNVRKIFFPYGKDSHIVVEIELDKEMKLPENTKAELESSVLGDTRINLILKGNPIAFLSPGDTLEGGPTYGAVEKLNEMIPVVQNILPKLDSILNNLNRLTANPALEATLKNTEVITENLKTSTTSINTFLQNDLSQISKGMQNISKNAEVFTNELNQLNLSSTANLAHQTLEELNKTSVLLNASLSSKNNTLGLLLNDSGLYYRLNTTIGNADSLVIDLKKNPKRYVHFSIFGNKNK